MCIARGHQLLSPPRQSELRPAAIQVFEMMLLDMVVHSLQGSYEDPNTLPVQPRAPPPPGGCSWHVITAPPQIVGLATENLRTPQAEGTNTGGTPTPTVGLAGDGPHALLQGSRTWAARPPQTVGLAGNGLRAPPQGGQNGASTPPLIVGLAENGSRALLQGGQNRGSIPP
jgi:hypothetical protein